MLKKHLAACLVATAFVAVPALAQTSNPTSSGATDRPTASGSGSATTGSPAMQPNASGNVPAGSTGTSSTMSSPTTGAAPSGSPATSTAGSSTGAATGSAQSSMAQPGAQGGFMTQLQPSQMMASSLIGTTIVGSNNESIGDVNDVVLDRSGRAMAVVIGVGGFLGIGEKDVAVPFSELEFGAAPMTAGAQGTMSAPAATDSAVNATGSTGSSAASNRATATTGNTGSGDPNTNAATDGRASVPDRIVLKMTKDELKAAPGFRSNNSRQNSDATGAAPATQKQ